MDADDAKFNGVDRGILSGFISEPISYHFAQFPVANIDPRKAAQATAEFEASRDPAIY